MTLKSNEMNRQTIENFFSKERKCIINTDLDGLLSGMILQYFLDWQIVGYSSCCGKNDDELWFAKPNVNIKECVFVDLPVCGHDYSVIDQHFVSYDMSFVDKYMSDNNKLNPNVLRNRVFKSANGKCEYTGKYPFGTVHFILALLEWLGIISKNFTITLNKKVGSFDVADLLLRADRVIGNTNQYTANCYDWIEWIKKFGGGNTHPLFDIAKNCHHERAITEKSVEGMLASLGCKGTDGDCSNLFRIKDFAKINQYFSFLSDSIDLPTLPSIHQLFDYGNLVGSKEDINANSMSFLKSQELFSYAFINMKQVSLTKFRCEELA
jgi:hypothetical protein